MRTGDIGFMENGQLFIVGRLKEQLIIRGRNLYPQDIERSIELSDRALRPGCCAVFDVETASENKIVLLQEIRSGYEIDVLELKNKIRTIIANEHRLPVYRVEFLRAGTIPKTSSGKLKRNVCRTNYLSGSFDGFVFR